MRTVKIYGYGDDNICFYGVTSGKDLTSEDLDYDPMCVGYGGAPLAEFYNQYTGDEYYEPAIFILGNEIVVIAEYGTVGQPCWTFNLGMRTENAGYPDWPTRVSQSKACGHSMQIEIDVPMDEVEVVRVK